MFVEQGNGESLYSDTVLVSDFNWIPKQPDTEISCLAKFRYRQDFQNVNVMFENGDVVIVCDEKQRAVTPGQYVVLYKEDENSKYDNCLGGGVIDSVIKNGEVLDV